METTPKSLRLQVAIFGRTNVGKSSILNMIAGQDVSITSPVPGTTTDVVEKSMELLPVGPVVFLDTAGIDDNSELGGLRAERTKKIFDRADVAVIVCEPELWGRWEEEIAAAARKKGIALLAVINKTDFITPSDAFVEKVSLAAGAPMLCCAVNKAKREGMVAEFKARLLALTNAAKTQPVTIVGDLVNHGETVILIIPIDKEAPKGRIILPQVQVMRDLLDHGAMFLTATEKEYASALNALSKKPALVICDSQVVDLMVSQTPPAVPCTTFSILFARFKGDLSAYASGAATIKNLRPGDRIAVLEACSHHAIEDDIGRVKLPKWLREYVGGELKIDTFSGRDLPADLSAYKLAIQCGGCMITRTEILNRMGKAAAAGIPITNYGTAISECKGVLERVLSPFPEALAAYRSARNSAV